MTALMEWLNSLWEAFIQFFTDLFDSLANLLEDLVYTVIELLFDLMLLILDQLPALDGLQQAFHNNVSALPADIMYFVYQAHVFEALGIIGTGVVFRIMRKVLTLGRW